MEFDWRDLVRYLVGFAWGLGLGVWLTEGRWKRILDNYHASIRQVIKLHDCGTARRGGWTMEDEANAIEAPRYPGPLYSQHERDAAVAREREEVQAHAPLYLEWVKEGALSADDALERLVIWLRARSAKGA